MSVTSFAPISISFCFSNLSPVSFSKFASCYRCSSCSLLSTPSQLSQGGVHYSCISHVVRCLAVLNQLFFFARVRTVVLTLADSSSVCSLLFPDLLLPANFLPLFPQLSLTLLLFAALFLLSIQFVISCCIWLISFSLPLNYGFVLFSSMAHTTTATLVSLFAMKSQLVTFSFSSFLVCISWWTRSLNISLSVISSFS